MKKTKYLFLGVLMVFVMSMIPFQVSADVTKTAIFHDDMNITINGTKYDARVAMIEGESYVPIHILGFVVNALTGWDEPNRIVNVTKQVEPVEIKKIEQTLDGNYTSKIAYFSEDIRLIVDGKQLEDQVIIIESRSYLPLKAIAENMGVRVTSDEENKTIKVVNPTIAKIDEALKDYYVTDLPKIQIEEDYLVGNWAGELTGKWSRGDRVSKLKAFISKNENGTYKVVLDWSDVFFNADKRLANQYTRNIDKNKFKFIFDGKTKIFEMNHYGTVEYTATYDQNTKILECVPTKLIKSYKKNDVIDGKGTFKFVLENEILHFYESSGTSITGGQLERF